MGIVYCVTNIKNQKRYIGKTVMSFSKRKNEHYRYAFNDSCKKFYFHRAIKKHGKDSFSWIILFRSDDNKKLIEKEEYFIKKYETTNSKNGYNLTMGGEGITGFRFSEETKRKMAISQSIKMKENPELLKALNDGRAMYSSKEEVKEKFKKRVRKPLDDLWKNQEFIKHTKERMSGGKNHAARNIVCVSTGKEYGCVIDAAKEYGISESTIRGILNKANHRASGQLWVDIKKWENKDFMKQFTEDSSKPLPINCAKKVMCVETGEIFSSCTKAGNAYNRNRNAIVRACNSLSAKCANLHWKFDE